MWVSFDSHGCSGGGGGDCIWRFHSIGGKTEAKRKGSLEAEPRPSSAFLRGWGGRHGAFCVFGVPSLDVSLESREVDKPSLPSPEAQAGSQAAAGLGQASSGGEEAGEAVCPAAGWASALLPRSSCLLAQWPHRQTRLVRAGGLQGELSSCG